MKIFIIVIVSAIVFSTMGYFVAKRVSNPEQAIPSEEVLKNSNEESTTTPAVDANSIFLKEEMARKKQRDIDREQCIANAEREYDEYLADERPCTETPTGVTCPARGFAPPVKENIDRCYFRFPTN